MQLPQRLHTSQVIHLVAFKGRSSNTKSPVRGRVVERPAADPGDRCMDPEALTFKVQRGSKCSGNEGIDGITKSESTQALEAWRQGGRRAASKTWTNNQISCHNTCRPLKYMIYYN